MNCKKAYKSFISQNNKALNNNVNLNNHLEQCENCTNTFDIIDNIINNSNFKIKEANYPYFFSKLQAKLYKTENKNQYAIYTKLKPALITAYFLIIIAIGINFGLYIINNNYPKTNTSTYEEAIQDAYKTLMLTEIEESSLEYFLLK